MTEPLISFTISPSTDSFYADGRGCRRMNGRVIHTECRAEFWGCDGFSPSMIEDALLQSLDGGPLCGILRRGVKLELGKDKAEDVSDRSIDSEFIIWIAVRKSFDGHEVLKHMFDGVLGPSKNIPQPQKTELEMALFPKYFKSSGTYYQRKKPRNTIGRLIVNRPHGYEFDSWYDGYGGRIVCFPIIEKSCEPVDDKNAILFMQAMAITK